MQKRKRKATGTGEGATPPPEPFIPPMPESRFRDVSPVGRADVALTRLTEYGLRRYGDPVLEIGFGLLRPAIELGFTALAGPGTQVGITSLQTVAVLRALKRKLDEAERGGTPA